MQDSSQAKGELKFDLVLHLAGEQILPNYMGIKLCQAPRHILLTTQKTKKHAEYLAKALPETQIIGSIVDPYDYKSLLEELEKQRAKTSKYRVGFNVTGGTKPMSVAAIDFCRNGDHEAIPFYIDTAQRKIFFFSEPYGDLPLPPVFEDVETFIKLPGYEVADPGVSSTDQGVVRRANLTKLLFENRNLLQAHAPNLAVFADDKKQREAQAQFFRIFSAEIASIPAAFSILDFRLP